MSDIPTKKEIVYLVEAQATSIDDISKRLVNLENLIEKQDNKNQNVIIGVLIAVVLIITTVAAEVILSDKKDASFYSDLNKNIYEQDLKVNNLNNEVLNIKIRNPYLK